MDADSIIALINACNPWNKGAVTKMNGRIIRLLEAEKSTGHPSHPKTAGHIINIDNGGMLVSSLHNEVIRVTLIYTEEGFFSNLRMQRPELITGGMFEKI